MMSVPTRQYTAESLSLAIEDVRHNKLSLRKAAMQYGIPKSTLSMYVAGKLEIGVKRGPASILSVEEERRLVEYVVHMGQIGYGRTREQLLDIVAKMVSSDGRENPFVNDRPGRKWWVLFKQRNPEVTLRVPEKLQLARARCCTPEILRAWFNDFQTFLKAHSLLNRSEYIWNADEAGFPLCATSGKIVSVHNCKNVYTITADTKEQITTLCAVSASGEVIPPMHIFPGMRFKYNPMLNSVDGAYFGHSPTGWISTELFYGWIANHFSKRVTVRPVVLLIDGHSSHIDLHTSVFCKENKILLYCLPPHSSHLTQPLDVSFFKPLKSAWGKACSDYCSNNPGYQVTKHEFSQIFREAWIASVRMSTIVNGFREAGICPFNPEIILKNKLLPSLQFSSGDKEAPATENPIVLFESLIGEEKVKKFEERLNENYDVETDELYCIWLKMKSLSISDDRTQTTSIPEDPVSLSAVVPAVPSDRSALQTTSDPVSSTAVVPSEYKKSSVLDDILVYPSVPDCKKSSRGTSAMPKHLSGEQFVHYLQEKKMEKEKIEEEKERRKEEREQKKTEREQKKEEHKEAMRIKKLEREKKKEEAERKKKERETNSWSRGRSGRGSRGGRGRGSRGGRGRGQAALSRVEDVDDSSSDGDGIEVRKKAPRGDSCSRTDQIMSSDVSSSDDTVSSGSDECIMCAVCNDDDDGRWIQCDTCDKWFHVTCVNLPEDALIENLDWLCPECSL